MAPAPMIAFHQSNRFVSVPMPSMTLTVLPGRIDPTPTDVPQAITSPASSRIARYQADELAGANTASATG